MNNFFRALIAGYGAKKLGGGCLGTVVVFIIIWVALGQCSWQERTVAPGKETVTTCYFKVDSLKSTVELTDLKL